MAQGLSVKWSRGSRGGAPHIAVAVDEMALVASLTLGPAGTGRPSAQAALTAPAAGALWQQRPSAQQPLAAPAVGVAGSVTVALGSAPVHPTSRGGLVAGRARHRGGGRRDDLGRRPGRSAGGRGTWVSRRHTPRRRRRRRGARAARGAGGHVMDQGRTALASSTRAIRSAGSAVTEARSRNARLEARGASPARRRPARRWSGPTRPAVPWRRAEPAAVDRGVKTRAVSGVEAGLPGDDQGLVEVGGVGARRREQRRRLLLGGGIGPRRRRDEVERPDRLADRPTGGTQPGQPGRRGRDIGRVGAGAGRVEASAMAVSPLPSQASASPSLGRAHRGPDRRRR